MVKKSRTLSNNLVASNSNELVCTSDSQLNNQKKCNKAKLPQRWFNFIMVLMVIGICVCIGLIIAQLIKIYA